MILTIDLGTSATKVALWTPDGALGVGRARLRTRQRPGGYAEQDPLTWWTSVVEACAQARAQASARGRVVDVEAIGFSAARQTFVAVDAALSPLGPALLWSDRRARAESAEIARRAGDQMNERRPTGVVSGAGSVAAKILWLARHEPGRLSGARWLLSARDLLVAHMTGAAHTAGTVRTDVTLASATGLYDADGVLVEELLEGTGAARLLPEPVPPTSVVGTLARSAADELQVAPGAPVVIGAGDRACEVVGAGAGPTRPMVSWGTTANVSLPLGRLPGRDEVPAGTILTASASGGWLVEAGLSAAGSLLEWVGALTGIGVAELEERGLSSPPGARGLLVMPWLGGARAPWWRDEAQACVLGISVEHGPADLARAATEGVAFEVARCLEAMGPQRGRQGHPFEALALAGGGSTMPLWTRVLGAVTGLPASCRRSGEAASAGAALLAARGIGAELDLDRLDPVSTRDVPEADDVKSYVGIRRRSDEHAAMIMGEPGGPVIRNT